MQAADNHAFAGDRFSLPEAMRVGSAAAADGVAFAPRVFELPAEHGGSPSPGRAAVRVGPEVFGAIEGFNGAT
jgi:hypothetical protein